MAKWYRWNVSRWLWCSAADTYVYVYGSEVSWILRSRNLTMCNGVGHKNQLLHRDLWRSVVHWIESYSNFIYFSALFCVLDGTGIAVSDQNVSRVFVTSSELVKKSATFYRNPWFRPQMFAILNPVHTLTPYLFNKLYHLTCIPTARQRDVFLWKQICGQRKISVSMKRRHKHASVTIEECHRW
jgi:hypothetical protein